MTSTLRKDIFGSACPEVPTKVHIEAMGGWDDLGLPYEGHSVYIPSELLSSEFDDGYGGVERPEWTAWSTNYVLFGGEYDGSTFTEWVRRDPGALKPIPSYYE